MRAVVFDLDDTLYPERDYVASGFKAVAVWSATNLGLNDETAFADLISLYDMGIRDDTFNRWLTGWGLDRKGLVKKLVEVYREHEPVLSPFDGIPELLGCLRSQGRLGILSDGYLEVQRRKLAALGLADFFDAVVFSDALGRECWKPSERPFASVLEKLDVEPTAAVYVADNPLKDFLGARKAGISTIRLRLPGCEHTDSWAPAPELEPDTTVESLEELGSMLIDKEGILKPDQEKVRQRISMSSPDLTAMERAAVGEVLETSNLSIGPKIGAFENALAVFTGAGFAAAVSSGTAGLHLAVIAAGVGENDLVVTTPFSFISSSNVVLYERGIPVFVDVDPITGNVDPLLVAECVEDMCRGGNKADRWLPPAIRGDGSVRKLKAILPVHAFGQPADMDPILKCARQADIAVIEDACEALGSEYKNRKAGTLGDAGVFAFYPNKQVTTGEGGMIVTDRSDWDPVFRSLRNQGRDTFNAWLHHVRLGYNYRLDEMSAALGTAQMARIEEMIEKRSMVADWYSQRLGGLDAIEVPFIADETSKMSWFVYVVKIKRPASRESLMASLKAKGIPSRPYFTPIHLQPFYAKKFGYRPGDFPVTEDLGNRCLALPFSSVMTEDQVDIICSSLAEAVSL